MVHTVRLLFQILYLNTITLVNLAFFAPYKSNIKRTLRAEGVEDNFLSKDRFRERNTRKACFHVFSYYVHFYDNHDEAKYYDL